MTMLGRLWADECGAIVPAEAVLVGTLAVAAVTVGGKLTAAAVDAEFRDLAHALRSLDQSYCIRGFYSPRAATAASSFRQEPVKKSLRKLRRLERELERQRLDESEKKGKRAKRKRDREPAEA